MNTLRTSATDVRSILACALVATALVVTDVRAAEATGDQAVVDAQMLIYEINLARQDPDAFRAKASDITMPAGIPAAPPLAIIPTLTSSATFKANEMALYEYFAHKSAVTGKWPNELARDHGYPLPAGFGNDSNNIESLHGGSPDPFRVLVSFANSPSHRRHIFGEGDFFGSHRQIGVGRSSTQNYWAVHTAYANSSDRFITGVVYNDLNSNGRMDLGEGLGGVTVSVGSQTTTTNAGGGYAIKVATGSYTVYAAGGGLSGISAKTVTVGTSSVLVDFVSGQSQVASGQFVDTVGHPNAEAIAWMSSVGLTAGCNPPVSTLYCPERLLNRAEAATFLVRAFQLGNSSNNGPFVDHLTSVHRTNINGIRVSGLTVGCSEDRYCPTRTLTRAEVATLLVRHFKLPSSPVAQYTDMAGHWGVSTINAAASSGLAWACNPPTNDRFCPNAEVNRAEIAQWLYRAWQLGYMSHYPSPTA